MSRPKQLDPLDAAAKLLKTEALRLRIMGTLDTEELQKAVSIIQAAIDSTKRKVRVTR